MTAADMNARVAAELAHLPRGEEPQNILRMLFRTHRLRTLGRHGEPGRTAADDLATAKAGVRQIYPGAVFIVADAFPG